MKKKDPIKTNPPVTKSMKSKLVAAVHHVLEDNKAELTDKIQKVVNKSIKKMVKKIDKKLVKAMDAT